MALRIVNACLSPGVGGEQVAFARYSTLFEAFGHDVISCVRRGAAVADTFASGTTVTELPSAFEFDPRSIWGALQLVADTKPDVIVAHSRRTFGAFAAARAVSGFAAPLIRVVHRPSFKGLDRADIVICVCPGLAAEAEKRIGDRSKVVCVPNFVPRAEAACDRPATTDPVIGFCGRFVPEKGVELLLAALHRLWTQGYRFQVAIAGDGPLRDQLMNSADAKALTDVVQWRGWLADPSAFFREIDVLVLPSRSEAFGLVTIEAFAAGRPVIATRTLGSTALVRSGSNGLLCDTSVESIAAAVAQVLADPALLARLSAQAAHDAQQYYPENVGVKLERCLYDAISRTHVGASETAAAAG
jgi:glycosyltransferase involved in cell wall biosynthesis